MNYFLTVILQLLLLLPGALAFGQSLSYQQAKTTMVENNKKLQSLSKQLEMDDYARKQASALRLPELKLTGMAVQLDEDLGLNLNDKRDQFAQLLQLPSSEILGSWNFVLQEKSFWMVGLDMKYPVFTGGKINAAVKAAELKSEMKKQEVSKEQNALLSELTTRYFQLQLALDAEKVRQQALDANKHHLDNARKLEANGLMASVETMQAEAAYADAGRELLAAQKDVVLAQTALAGTLGLDSLPGSPETPLFLPDALQPLEFYEEQAVQFYPDINKLFLMQELSQQGLKAKKAAYVPDVALMGNYRLAEGNLASVVPDWYLGVGFSFTLFDGLSRRNEVREYSTMKESIQLMREQATQDIRILVRKHYQELEKHAGQVAALAKDEAFAEELLRVREKAFVEGFSSSVDVVDANLYLASIRLKRLKSLCEYDLTLASLLEVCGDSYRFDSYIAQ